MAAKKKIEEAGLDRQIGIRMSVADYARLEKLSTHLSVGTLARVAMLIGIDVIESQPGVLLGEKPKPRK